MEAMTVNKLQQESYLLLDQPLDGEPEAILQLFVRAEKRIPKDEPVGSLMIAELLRHPELLGPDSDLGSIWHWRTESSEREGGSTQMAKKGERLYEKFRMKLIPFLRKRNLTLLAKAEARIRGDWGVGGEKK
jgi:hypothetical protein